MTSRFSGLQSGHVIARWHGAAQSRKTHRLLIALAVGLLIVGIF